MRSMGASTSGRNRASTGNFRPHLHPPRPSPCVFLDVNGEETGTSDDLLTRALAGEAAAFGMLVRMHQRPVYSLALRMLSDRHEAEDLAQEVFLGLHRNLSSAESAAHLSFWLARSPQSAPSTVCGVRPGRRCPGGRRLPGQRRSTEQHDPLFNVGCAPCGAASQRRRGLSTSWRDQEDLNPNEIARTLNMSIHTVKSDLKRSLRITGADHGRCRPGPRSGGAPVLAMSR